MALELLSRVENWKICEQTQDVRGQKLVDDAGNSLGVVRDLIVNTESGVVERLVLDNRAEYDVRDVILSGDTLQLSSSFLSSSGTATATEPETLLRIRCERM